MKTPFLPLLALSLALGASSGTALAYSASVDNLFATIPDNDLNGYQNSFSLSGFTGLVTHVSVTLNISGGLNGDLYAFLQHNHTNAILLNRVGVSASSKYGYRDSGFGPDGGGNKFTLDDGAGQDVHLYHSFGYSLNLSGQLTGQWQPDGRAIDPQSAGSAFDTAARSNGLGLFNGMDPNGQWTLYVADVSPLGESTLVGWGLTVDVPEPGSALLLGCGLASAFLSRRLSLFGGVIQKRS